MGEHVGWRTQFPYGFLGVDIFFVISGYLITGLLYRDIVKKRSFTTLVAASVRAASHPSSDTISLSETESLQSILRDFYLRRIRRIAPALLTMLIGSFLLLMVFFLPHSIVKGVLCAINATLLCCCNLYYHLFRLAGGYWENNAALEPFLHMWSLSLEEQFYFVWPWIMFGADLLARKIIQKMWGREKWGDETLNETHRRASCILLIGVSLAVGIISYMYTLEAGLANVYFVLHARAFELLFGGVLALLVVAREEFDITLSWSTTTTIFLRNFFGFLGLFLMLYAALAEDFLIQFAYNEEDPANAIKLSKVIEAILGAFLFIAAGTPERKSRKVPEDAPTMPDSNAPVRLLVSTQAYSVPFRLIGSKVFVSSGLLSYSLYLWHFPLFVIARYHNLLNYYKDPQLFLVGAFLIILTYVFAFLTYRYVETPLRFVKVYSFSDIFSAISGKVAEKLPGEVAEKLPCELEEVVETTVETANSPATESTNAPTGEAFDSSAETSKANVAYHSFSRSTETTDANSRGLTAVSTAEAKTVSTEEAKTVSTEGHAEKANVEAIEAVTKKCKRGELRTTFFLYIVVPLLFFFTLTLVLHVGVPERYHSLNGLPYSAYENRWGRTVFSSRGMTGSSVNLMTWKEWEVMDAAQKSEWMNAESKADFGSKAGISNIFIGDSHLDLRFWDVILKDGGRRGMGVVIAYTDWYRPEYLQQLLEQIVTEVMEANSKVNAGRAGTTTTTIDFLGIAGNLHGLGLRIPRKHPLAYEEQRVRVSNRHDSGYLVNKYDSDANYDKVKTSFKDLKGVITRVTAPSQAHEPTVVIEYDNPELLGSVMPWCGLMTWGLVSPDSCEVSLPANLEMSRRVTEMLQELRKESNIFILPSMTLRGMCGDTIDSHSSMSAAHTSCRSYIETSDTQYFDYDQRFAGKRTTIRMPVYRGDNSHITATAYEWMAYRLLTVYGNPLSTPEWLKNYDAADMLPESEDRDW